jgi:CubicO group peptidase (beta-lactamase class C family)
MSAGNSDAARKFWLINAGAMNSEIMYPPGTIPAYSNYAPMVAAYIVQRVSGQPFDDYVEQHIFQPLKMTHADFSPAFAL